MKSKLHQRAKKKLAALSHTVGEAHPTVGDLWLLGLVTYYLLKGRLTAMKTVGEHGREGN